jgi:polyisoprenoid-binding protein YceI
MARVARHPRAIRPERILGAQATDADGRAECGEIKPLLPVASEVLNSKRTRSASTLQVMHRVAGRARPASIRAWGKPFLLAAALVLVSHIAWPATADVTKRRYANYRLAPERSSVALVVPIIGHSYLRMSFRRIDAMLARPIDGAKDPQVTVTIDAASLDANKPFATSIVKSDAVLDVAHYPSIRFASTRFARTTKDTGFLTGDLTIRGTTRPVTLFVTLEQKADRTFYDGESLSFAAEGHFSRATFGLSAWSTTIGDDIHMMIRAEFVRVGAPDH